MASMKLPAQARFKPAIPVVAIAAAMLMSPFMTSEALAAYCADGSGSCTVNLACGPNNSSTCLCQTDADCGILGYGYACNTANGFCYTPTASSSGGSSTSSSTSSGGGSTPEMPQVMLMVLMAAAGGLAVYLRRRKAG